MAKLSKADQQTLVQNIKEKNDIVAVIAEYVTLRRAGRSFQGLCPFHSEKTPSFNVNPEKQFFYCFGCGIGGDIFSFLMKMENLEFREAAKRLADRAGIVWLDAADTTEADRQKESYYRINLFAARFFHQCLINTESGKRACQYLSRRGIHENIWKEFTLGYAPAAWHALTDVLRTKAIPLEYAEKLGLIGLGEKGFYDRFRDRIIFPITDTKGKVVGFGGRIIEGSDPKYLNTPETVLFHKGFSLYALNLAKDTMKKRNQAIIVEGYLDAIQAHQAGFSHTVASLGTALTKEQARLLKRYAAEVVLAYDADTAGQNATVRGMEILERAGFTVKIPHLPAGDDPDSLIREQGSEVFGQFIEQAVNLVDFKLRLILNQYQLESPEGKTAAIQALLPEIAAIENTIRREAYVRKLVREIGVSETAIEAELLEWRKRQHRKAIIEDKTQKNRDNTEIDEKIGITVGGINPPDLTPFQRTVFDTEKELLKSILQEYDKFERIKEELKVEEFSFEPWRKLFSLMLTADANRDVQTLFRELEGSSRETAAALIAEQEVAQRHADFPGSLQKLRMLHIQQEIQNLTEQINTRKDQTGKALSEEELKVKLGQFTELNRRFKKDYPQFSTSFR